MNQELANEFEQNYVEQEILGEGCASVVKKCEEKQTKETRAVKIIRSDDDEFIEISKREFSLVSSLDHPNIVKMQKLIHDTNKGTLYLVMEFVKGQTLEDYVFKEFNSEDEKARAKFVSEETIQTIAIQTLSTLQYLHQQGVCHRDIKPDNLMLIENPGFFSRLTT